MDHRELYLQLLSLGSRERLLEVIREQGFFDKLKIIEARVVEAEPLPYLRFEIAPDPGFIACCGGLILDLREIVGAAPERYYLPYVAFTPRAQAAEEAHELKHLADLMELLRVEPAYADDAERLGMCNVSDPELLEPSIHFEVRKLFLLEVPAFELDFDSGTHGIDIPLLPDFSVRYQCGSREEFVKLWLASYLKSFLGMYSKRFPACAQRIEQALATASNGCGHARFGEHAWAQVMKEWDELPERFAAQALGRLRATPIPE